MRDKDLYAQILGIKSPWQVSSVELALSEREVTVHVEQEKGAKQCCPTCGKGAVNLKQNPADYPHEKQQIVVP